jgi:lipid-A-disaccharide synthase
MIELQNILIVSGEHSGDSLGGDLVREFKKINSNFQFFGIGGTNMISEGVRSIYDIEELNVIGFSGIVFKYRKLKKIANQLVQECITKNVKYVILIDYPGFNLELASMLKNASQDIKIIFYVSPQIWAWRFNRIHKIKKYVDLQLLLFPFEKKIYDRYNIDNEVVGHPLMGKMQSMLETGLEIKTNDENKVITLMPGSRTGEIKRLLHLLLDSAKVIHDKHPNTEFLLPGINEKESKFIERKVETFKKENPNIKISYQFNNSAKCIEKADMVILASGTATLEVAYFKKPMIILYINSFLTHFIGKRVLLIPYVGLVNILAEKFIVKELLQSECTTKNITEEAFKILENKLYREEMIYNISAIKESLGTGDSSKKAANAILKLISSSPSPFPS